MTAKELIQHLGLEEHPEGGYYRETYRSTETIPVTALEGYAGERNYSTAIYFLLTSENYSAFHRVRQDELWHFHQGSPIELHMISPEGEHNKVIIGNNVIAGEQPQMTVPGGYWFAAHVIEENGHSLVSCTVAPGFNFNDFELAERQLLTEQFPQHKTLISSFTRS